MEISLFGRQRASNLYIFAMPTATSRLVLVMLGNAVCSAHFAEKFIPIQRKSLSKTLKGN